MLNNVSVDGHRLLLQLPLLVVVLWLDVVRGFLDLAVQALLARLLDGQVSDPLPLLPLVVNVLEPAVDFFLLIQILLPLHHLSKDLISREKVVLDPVLDGIQDQWDQYHHKNQLQFWIPLQVA